MIEMLGFFDQAVLLHHPFRGFILRKASGCHSVNVVFCKGIFQNLSQCLGNVPISPVPLKREIPEMYDLSNRGIIDHRIPDTSYLFMSFLQLRVEEVYSER